MKILTIILWISYYVNAQQNDWEPINHPNGGYSIQQSFISTSSSHARDDRKLPSSRNDVDSAASVIISPIAQDVDNLHEFNKQNFIDDVSKI
jgi:hypothetical protein